MRGAGGVGAHQDLDVLDVTRPGSARAPGRAPSGGRRRCSRRRSRAAARRRAPPGSRSGVGVQRVEPVAALVVAGRALLLRVRGDQRRVDVDRQPLGRAVQLPEPLARPRVRRAQRVQQPRLRRDPVDHPERGRVRRHRPEQRLLVAHRAEIRHALAAVGEHHRQITDHPARVMTATPLLQPRQPQRQRAREPELVSDLRQQRAARVRHQTRSVRRDIYGYRASIAHHLQGEPPSSGSGPSASPRIPAQPDKSAPPPPGARSYCTIRVRACRKITR